ncbi:hypothetical protein AB0M29_20475 [Streptomyces sp. NPDC051976]|uniref:hypothetical protein n=1 Tax=Streptomyces sp. NPDC051976 TaxID=3154947 RepID=UPI003448CA56
MGDVVYRSHGTPLENYQLTREDRRRQKGTDVRRTALERQFAKWAAEEAADPVLKREREKRHIQALEMLASWAEAPADSELIRWWVRLYCGHFMEIRRYPTSGNPTRQESENCPECGQLHRNIVAFEPLGAVAQPPRLPTEPTSNPKKPTRTQLERRIAVLEAENRQLKARQDYGGEESRSGATP